MVVIKQKLSVTVPVGDLQPWRKTTEMEPPTFEIEVPTLVAVPCWVGAQQQALKRLITEEETKPKKADVESGAAQPRAVLRGQSGAARPRASPRG